MQNDWTPIEQVMAHGWLPCHSELGQLANSVSSQPWLVHTPSGTHYNSTRQVNEGRNLDDEINTQAGITFGLSGDIFPLKSCLVVGSAFSVNKICILFWRKTMLYLNQILTNPYLEEESVSVLFRLEIAYLAKLISDNFWSVNRGHNPRHGIWNNPMCNV